MNIIVDKYSGGHFLKIEYSHANTTIAYDITDISHRKETARMFISIAEKLLEGIKDGTT